MQSSSTTARSGPAPRSKPAGSPPRSSTAIRRRLKTISISSCAAATSLIPWDAFLANDHDFDGDTLSIVSVSGVTAGAAVTIAGSSLHLVTAPSFEGPVGFTYEVSDGHGGVDTADVEIVVIANHAPAAIADDGFETEAGAAISIAEQALLANDTDADGDALSVVSVQGAAPRRGGARRQRAHRVYARPPDSRARRRSATRRPTATAARRRPPSRSRSRRRPQT